MKNVLLNELVLDLPPEGGNVALPGVHTRNGDSIEVDFRLSSSRAGEFTFGYSGGFEHALVTLRMSRGRSSLHTTDWTRPQPAVAGSFSVSKRSKHSLRIEKTEGNGGLVKNANIRAFLDGKEILRAEELNLLPEMQAHLQTKRVRIERFAHRGRPSSIPDYLHVGGWQMLNTDSIEQNLASLRRGIEQAAEQGVQLLVTPETSLTGLFPRRRVTKDRSAVAEAERELRKTIRGVPDAPYVVVGLPAWERNPDHRRKLTRYNVSTLYAPDGHAVSTHAKIHSCEPVFWHGYRLHEFDVYGVPVCMHICHDGRYPEVWTLPVMFGARLVLHPANSGEVSGSIDAFEARARTSASTSHAFYVNVNGGGGSYIAGPQKYDNLIAVSTECRRDSRTFPTVGRPEECLVHARVRIADAFGYWPVRSFRASEEIATSYLRLYRAMGGTRWPCDADLGDAAREHTYDAR